MDDLLLEGAVEAFDDAVGLGFADESETGRKAVVAALALEVVGEILAAVIVAQFDAAGGLRRGRAEDARDRPPKGVWPFFVSFTTSPAWRGGRGRGWLGMVLGESILGMERDWPTV